METSTDINEIAGALAKAQATVKGATKDSLNPHFKSQYADLSSVWEACREALTANNLAIVQTPHTDDAGKCHVVTMLMHSSGQWIRDTFCLSPTKQDPQGYGSAITYMRRYALAAMVGVAPEDDDGNAAAANDGKQQPQQQKAQPKQAAPKQQENKPAHVQQAEALLVKLRNCQTAHDVEVLWDESGPTLSDIQSTSKATYDHLDKQFYNLKASLSESEAA